MIKKMTIINFQCHKKRTVTFTKGITSIVGSTDVGKSTIFRALKWVCTNKPDGDDFIKHGEKTVKVILRTDEHKVVRIKGPGKNIYKLDNKVFHAFGRGKVPDEIRDALQIDFINFQNQHDSPFWFGESAGEVSRQLNQIVNLGVIDDTLSDLSSACRKSKVEMEVSDDRISELRKEKKDKEDVPSMLEDYEELETLQNLVAEKELDHESIVSLIGTIQEQASLQSQVEELGTLVKDGEMYLLMGERLIRLDETSSVLKKYIKLKGKLVGRKMSLAEFEEIIEEIKSKETRIGLIGDHLLKVAEQESKLCHARNQLKAHEKNLKESTNGKCPICGSEMS